MYAVLDQRWREVQPHESRRGKIRVENHEDRPQLAHVEEGDWFAGVTLSGDRFAQIAFVEVVRCCVDSCSMLSRMDGSVLSGTDLLECADCDTRAECSPKFSNVGDICLHTYSPGWVLRTSHVNPRTPVTCRTRFLLPRRLRAAAVSMGMGRARRKYALAVPRA